MLNWITMPQQYLEPFNCVSKWIMLNRITRVKLQFLKHFNYVQTNELWLIIKLLSSNYLFINNIFLICMFKHFLSYLIWKGWYVIKYNKLRNNQHWELLQVEEEVWIISWLYIIRGMLSLKVIIIGNGIGDLSSNPRQDFFHFVYFWLFIYFYKIKNSSSTDKSRQKNI